MLVVRMIVFRSAAQKLPVVAAHAFELKRRVIDVKFVRQCFTYFTRQFIDTAQHLIGDGNVDGKCDAFIGRILDVQIMDFQDAVDGFQRSLDFFQVNPGRCRIHQDEKTVF